MSRFYSYYILGVPYFGVPISVPSKRPFKKDRSLSRSPSQTSCCVFVEHRLCLFDVKVTHLRLHLEARKAPNEAPILCMGPFMSFHVNLGKGIGQPFPTRTHFLEVPYMELYVEFLGTPQNSGFWLAKESSWTYGPLEGPNSETPNLSSRPAVKSLAGEG